MFASEMLNLILTEQRKTNELLQAIVSSKEQSDLKKLFNPSITVTIDGHEIK